MGVLAGGVAGEQTQLRHVLIRRRLQIKEHLHVLALVAHHHLVVVTVVEHRGQIRDCRLLVARHLRLKLALRLIRNQPHAHPKIGGILDIGIMHLRRDHHHLLLPLGELHAHTPEHRPALRERRRGPCLRSQHAQRQSVPQHLLPIDIDAHAALDVHLDHVRHL